MGKNDFFKILMESHQKEEELEDQRIDRQATEKCQIFEN